ncbi:hypothetical protein [Acinetobacter sp. YH12086]|uniref:hypothetical protein n=1 Tax=Acinetobacter sp. YH12086 TaxID=2601078 RepID=UPI0015D12740|nr:hypothetical protein [Acinetobacter sp. YH12086]
MKMFILLAGVTLLSGCMFGTSSEIKKAEKLLSHFQCNNIESSHMTHSSITTFHEEKLASSKQKVVSYIDSYKQGEKLFRIPLIDVVDQQYIIYKAACQNLGGIHPDFND